MASRNRQLRKLSGVVPNTPEFDVLVRRSQVYREALGEAVELREMLRRAHAQNIELRRQVTWLNNTLIQLKLAAMNVMLDDKRQELSLEDQARFAQAQAEQQAGSVEARPEERAAAPAA